MFINFTILFYFSSLLHHCSTNYDSWSNICATLESWSPFSMWFMIDVNPKSEYVPHSLKSEHVPHLLNGNPKPVHIVNLPCVEDFYERLNCTQGSHSPWTTLWNPKKIVFSNHGNLEFSKMSRKIRAILPIG